MKQILLSFWLSHLSFALAMEAPRGVLARRSSSGHMSTVYGQHKRRSSLGQNALSLLRPKTEDCSEHVMALATDRRTPSEQVLLDKSKTSTENLSKSNSQTWINLAVEKNRNDFNEMVRKAHVALANIQVKDDEAHKEFKGCLKWARHYYKAWISLEVTKDPRTIEIMIQEQFKPLEDASHKKMASLLPQRPL